MGWVELNIEGWEKEGGAGAGDINKGVEGGGRVIMGGILLISPFTLTRWMSRYRGGIGPEKAVIKSQMSIQPCY